MEYTNPSLLQQDSLDVLLVEDNQHDALAMQRVVRESAIKCRITLHTRAESVLSLLSGQNELLPHIDLIICDQKLPGISGLELYKILQEKNIQVPFILLTGSGAEELAVEALKLGVSDYIMKDQQSRYLHLLPTVLPQVVAHEREKRRRQEAEWATARRGQMLASLVEVQKRLLSFDVKTDLQSAYREILALLSDLLRPDRMCIFENQYGANGALYLSLEAEWHLRTLRSMQSLLGAQTVLFSHLLPPWSEVILKSGNVLSNQTWLSTMQHHQLVSEHLPTYPLNANGAGPQLHETALYFPMLSQGKPLGIFAIEKSSFAGALDEAEMDLLRGVAAAISQWREQRRSEEQLRAFAGELKQQNQELDAFAHMVAHDLKNPLAVLSTTSDVLAEMQADLSLEETQEMFGMIQEYTQKAIDIVNELLLLSSARREDVDIEPISMGPIVRHAIDQLNHVIEETEASIQVPSQWPLVMGHAPWIEAVWINYISNGLKYGGSPPKIEVGVERRGEDLVCFWVEDNGNGIMPEAQKKLFTPFTRLAQYKAQGHGLGLSIVSRVIQKLGGDVGVESSGKAGEGSRFFFTLPAAHIKI